MNSLSILTSIATATYRLMPKITLLQEVRGEVAEKLAKCFPTGVVEVEDRGGAQGIGGNKPYQAVTL